MGYPRFKKKGGRDSARIYEVSIEERHLRIPHVGRVRLKETRGERGFEGRPLSATISRRADRWFASLTVERERTIVLPHQTPKSRDVIGVDLGLANAAVIHDGNEMRIVEPRRALRKNLRRVRRLDRQVARKQIALSIGDAGMGELRRQLVYKSDWYGATLVLG
jgi:putative transposase